MLYDENVSAPGKFVAAWFTLGGAVAIVRALVWLIYG